MAQLRPVSVITARTHAPPCYSRTLWHEHHAFENPAHHSGKESGAVLLRGGVPPFSKCGILVLRGGSPEDAEDAEMGGENELLAKLAAEPDSEQLPEETLEETTPKVSDPRFENILKSQPVYKAELQVDVGNLCVMDVDTNIPRPPENEEEGRVMLEATQKAVTRLFEDLHALPRTGGHGDEVGQEVILPEGKELLPMIRKEMRKGPSKWQQFAQAKGIDTAGKKKKVWDEKRKKWLPAKVAQRLNKKTIDAKDPAEEEARARKEEIAAAKEERKKKQDKIERRSFNNKRGGGGRGVANKKKVASQAKRRKKGGR